MSKELSHQEKTSLIASTIVLIERLEKNVVLNNIQMPAFDFYSENTKEKMQVQITVTRYKRKFLDEFQTVSEYNN